MAHGTPPRHRRRLRRTAAMASMGLALALLPTMGTASAETFTDPNDRCLPGEDAPPAPFSDRDQISPAHLPSVDCIAAMKIGNGQGDGTYNPKGMTRRDQMATFIVNSLRAAGYDLPEPEDTPFTDIEGNVHAENIGILVATGITSGKTETTYAPAELVRRDQMVSFLVQAAEYAFGDDDLENPFAPGEEPTPAFDDVSPDNVHAANIDAGALVLGLVDGKAPRVFDPAMFTAREQMASFLVRLVDLTLIVE